MVKLVVFKLGDGTFEQGFPITLQIGEDGDRPTTEIRGRLPPNLEIPQFYNYWQSVYYRLGLRSRLEAVAVQVTNVSVVEDCYKAAQQLCHSLNRWLQSESFRPIREKLLEKLVRSDEVRVILQTEDLLLQRLPWHLCDLFELYTKAEIALSAPAYESTEQVTSFREKIRILAILGNSAGIDTKADRALLEQLPDAEVSFLVEPQRQELTRQLWAQGWDILFFAGHSSSQTNGESGRIYINQTDSLTISDLQYALHTAVEHGLKLAIFNSCDGLGLARELASLQIPQVVVMREPVPDKVAQEFLKYFLPAFAGGKSFYLAVREAREKLQGLEDQFPCASWLPVIYQNPAEVPLTWQGLCHHIDRDRTNTTTRRSLRQLLLASVAIASVVIGVRHLGFLQPLELQAFDQLLQQRPSEEPDPRLLVVTITEADIQAQKHEPGQGSLSDPSLKRLLQKLEKYQPSTIGLDIYRPLPVEANFPQLKAYLQQNQRFFAVCKVSDPSGVDEVGVPPPPEVAPERLGFSDVIPDNDRNIVRRHYINFDPPLTSACSTKYALSLLLALHYLHTQGIEAKSTPEGLQIGDVVLPRLKNHTSGYQQLDDKGYQLLLNYRRFESLGDIAQQVTLGQILSDRISPDLAKTLKNRIVLIGVTAPSSSDHWLTPYSAIQQPSEQEIPGVFLQAQMVSQIISAVLDQRPLLWVWSGWHEALWIWAWSLVGGILAGYLHSPLRLGLANGAALAVLYSLCYVILLQGGWIPLVPPALGLVATGGSVVLLQRHFLNKSNLSASASRNRN